MGWGWKAAGTYFGSLGGPLGALVGLGVGHVIDKWAEPKPGNGQQLQPKVLTDQQKARVGYLYCLSAFLWEIAKADGVTHPKEQDLIYKVTKEAATRLQAGLNEYEVRSITDGARGDYSCFSTTLDYLQKEKDLRFVFLRYAWRIAAKDGQIVEAELSWIKNTGQRMGATTDEIVQSGIVYYRPQENSAQRNSALDTLGLPYDANHEMVRQRYRDLAGKFHPDRHPTAAPELRDLAAERFAIISNAYKILANEAPGKAYYAKAPGVEITFTPRESEKIECFMCSAVCAMPPIEYASRVRCPDCQALMLFRGELADALVANA